MISKLKLFLLRHSKERGAVLPMALGLGVIMVLVGGMMIARSQSGETTAEAQNKSLEASALSEGALNKVLADLNIPTNSIFLSLNYDEWTSPPSDVSSPCVSSEEADDFTGENALGEGAYKVTDYTFNEDTSTGTLTVQAKVGGSVSEVEVAVDIREATLPGTFPGLYAAEDVDMGNVDLVDDDGSSSSGQANIICEGNNGGCPLPDDSEYCSNPVSDAAQDDAAIAVGSGPNSEVEGIVYIGKASLPELKTFQKLVDDNTPRNTLGPI